MEKLYTNNLRYTKQKSITPNDRNLTNSEIEKCIVSITELIQQNVKHNTHKRRQLNNMECFTNNIIEKLYKHKSRLITTIKNLKRTGSNNIQQINLLKSEIKRTNELIKQNIQLQINKHYKNKMEAIKPGARMFKEIKTLRNDVAGNRGINMLNIDEHEANALTNININWDKMPKTGSKFNCFNIQDNLNIIGHYIEKNTYDNPALGKKGHEEIILRTVQNIKQQQAYEKDNNITKCTFDINNKANEQQEHQNYFISYEELKSILSCVNNKKSYGLDNIPSIVLKHLPDQIVLEICTIFNQLLNNRAFPSCWKKARIFPIKKKGKDESNPINYRPISLLSNLGKIFEIIIYNKIYKYTNVNNLIPDNQFGFRHNHTTTHAITNMTNHIAHNLNYNICTGAVLIDMEKAFESVWLDGLIYKLNKMKFDRDILYILVEMLYSRKFITTIGNESSTKIFNIHNGLQQGSITAPLLFNLYTKDLISNEKLNSSNIHTIAYADDIVIFSSNKKISKIQEDLQSATDFLINFLHTWRIKVNESKSETILFRRPYKLANTDTRKNKNNLKIKINNINIEQKPYVKYLGVNIDQFLYLTGHINKQITKAKNAFFSNKAIFYSKFIDTQVKRICYQTLIRPIITYACPAWFNCNDGYMERIRLFERKCIRHCTGFHRKAESGYLHYISNREQYGKFKTDRIDIHIIKLIRNHINRTTLNCENSLTFGPYYTDEAIIEKSIKVNNIPGPEAFLYLDKKGFIQDENQLPIIYHINRKPNEKGFDLTKFMNANSYLRYSTEFKKIDNNKYIEQKAKYWWLQ